MNGPVLDIPRSYTGIAEWLACLVYASLFAPRFPLKRQIPLAGACLLVQCAFLVMTDHVPLAWWTPCMIAAFAMMVGQILLLAQLKLKEACYLAVHAFLLAEFAASLQWQFHYYFWQESDPVAWQKYALLIVIFTTVYIPARLAADRLSPPPRRLEVTGGELAVVLSIGIMAFAVSNVSFYNQESPFSGFYAADIMNIRTLVDFAGNAVLLAYLVQRKWHRAQRELAAVQSILENQYAQYRLSRDTMELINQKYHDLKHLIAVLRSEPDSQVREQWLDAMEADIRAYEVQTKTGNHVLDTVLTGKSLYCQSQGIELVVSADGSLLSFMDTVDICTVFGNALDNAIECVMKLPDPSKRLIRLVLTAQKQFLVLKVENYCPFQPRFQDGLPATTKEDPGMHGFGLKSIRYTARKYGGSITTAVEDGWFVLKLLIPMNTENS